MNGLRAFFYRLIRSTKSTNDEVTLQQAFELENIARQIRGLAPRMQQSEDIEDILHSVKALLQPLAENNVDMDAASVTDVPDSVLVTEDVIAATKTEVEPAEEPTTREVIFTEKDREPSKLAIEIIRLRDWTLVSRSGGCNEETGKVLEALYFMLGQALTLEDITEYEVNEGMFDPSKQQAVMSAPSPEDTKKNTIHTSIRPGYVFMGRILRQQQVSIFI